MTKAEKALIEAAIEEQRLSRLLARHICEVSDKWWDDWQKGRKAYKCAVRRVVKERRGK
jgi:hypothetical protein